MSKPVRRAGPHPVELAGPVRVRPTEPRDFDGIITLCERVYPGNVPWSREQLRSHLEVFPEGQLTAVEDTPEDERVVGMAASLVLSWDDYDFGQGWRDFTARGTFTNHDTFGRTLYGAEVMVDPHVQGRGVGSLIYDARDDVMRRLGLLRIRAGARLRGYHAYAELLSPEEYVEKVVAEEVRDPTLSFQLHRGFRVLAVVGGYLANDAESLGYAAVIEKLNEEVGAGGDRSVVGVQGAQV